MEGIGKAIFQTSSGLTVGLAALGARSGVAGSVRQEVHDGDTINVRTVDNFGVRFLGSDAAEISFTLPGETAFVGIGDQRWDVFLTDPLDDSFGPFQPALDAALVQHIRDHTGPGTAANHRRHAKAAEDRLEQEVANDLAAVGATEETFRFFLAFAQDVVDRYGRFLCYLNRDQPSGPRPLTYNERLLNDGTITPYFIWPNTQPFTKQPSLLRAVIEPGKAVDAGNAARLGDARRAVKAARAAGTGIFAANDPLRLLPFELRFLARRGPNDQFRRPPDRWVIDLTADGNQIIHPQRYHTVQFPEDRLFIPDYFVSLFVEAGWQRQPAP